MSRTGSVRIVGIVAALGVSGCLIPPPLEQAPEPENHPPRIVPAQLVPSPAKLPREVPDACPDIEPFQASVIEPDGDNLFYRVFVDYNAGGNRTPQPTELVTEPDLAESVQFSVQRSSFVGDNPHVVELFVADRPFEDRGSSQEGRDLDPNQGVPYFDTFVWTVVLVPTLDWQCP